MNKYNEIKKLTIWSIVCQWVYYEVYFIIITVQNNNNIK